MNGKDLLIGIGNISHKYYEEAENGTLAESRARRSIRRPLLVAAIVALLLMLVGCAVVYVLRLQDMSIGTETYTQIFDDDGKYLEEPVEKTRDVLSLFGHSGDNVQKATAEWFAFLETYDPDGELVDNNPDHAEIPNQYEYTYGCYTPEMAAKVDEIAAKYNLKLLEEWLPFQAWQSDIFLEESGIHSLVRPDSAAEVTRLSGMFYPPYNFDVDIELSADSLENDLWITVLYARKDYFPRDYPGGTDLSLYEQWDYTAPDGTALLLALNNKGRGYVIAELDNAMMILSVDGNYSSSAYPTEEEIMTREELEAAAAVFDYSIQPQILNRTPVEQRLEESNKAYEAEHAYVPETFGSFADYIKSNYFIYDDDLQYLFFDMTGDGEPELLIGQNGYYDTWITHRDGQTLAQNSGTMYLCEGGAVEWYYDDPYFGHYETRHYYAPISETAIDDLDHERKTIINLKREGNQWTQGEKDTPVNRSPITQTEVEAIIAQYPRRKLDWRPLMEFPLDENGYTFGDYLSDKDVRVSDEELHQIYRDRLNGSMHYSHYRILDINGDGVDDLLLKGEDSALGGNTDFYWAALTYRYGTITRIASDFYLCEEGVLEKVVDKYDTSPGVEINGHWFMRINGFEEDRFAFAAYNKATASWQGDWYGEVPMTEDEAKAILAKYPRIDQGMQPISELLN
ncbi:MAG: hypothetical protein IJN20_08690 [Oscillospiraceae bacterium]|nr:hypothetical protein [Oscillospiraceae bacterium]